MVIQRNIGQMKPDKKEYILYECITEVQKQAKLIYSIRSQNSGIFRVGK